MLEYEKIVHTYVASLVLFFVKRSVLDIEFRCAAAASHSDSVPVKDKVPVSVPVKTYDVPVVNYVVKDKYPPPPPPEYVVKVETPVPEVVVSGARIYSPPPPAEVRPFPSVALFQLWQNCFIFART